MPDDDAADDSRKLVDESDGDGVFSLPEIKLLFAQLLMVPVDELPMAEEEMIKFEGKNKDEVYNGIITYMQSKGPVTFTSLCANIVEEINDQREQEEVGVTPGISSV